MLHLLHSTSHCFHLVAAAVVAAAGSGMRGRLISHSTAITATNGMLSNGDSPSDSAEHAPPVSSSTNNVASSQQPELVDQFLAAVKSSRRQQLQQRKVDIIQEYQRVPADVGSSEVQIALLTDKIRDMAEHFQKHRKDHHSMRGLQGMLNQRRKLLGYLRQSNFSRYAFVLHKLGLKDTYAKQERYDKYRVGSGLGTPAEPLRRYGNSAEQKKKKKAKK